MKKNVRKYPNCSTQKINESKGKGAFIQPLYKGKIMK